MAKNAHMGAPREPGRRVRDAIALVVLLVVMLAPCACFILEHAGLALPQWLDGSTAAYLSGSSVEDPFTEDGAAAWKASLTEGGFKGKVEGYVLDNTPFRAQALIANAELQRDAIRASNLLFQWPAYPCYYGSQNYLISEYDAVKPVQNTGLVSGWQRFSQELAAFSAAHPTTQFAVVLPAESTEPASNPAIALTSNGVTNEEMAATFEASLADAPNVSVIAQDFESGSDYYDQYFHYDHHWTAAGAVAAYNQLAEATGLEALEVEGIVEQPVGYMGSLSRQGLTGTWDSATDISNSFSDIRFTDANGNTVSAADHSYYDSLPNAQKFTDYYSSYFSGLNGVFENDAAPLQETVLEVSDSFGDAFTRLIATSASRVVNVDWLTQESSGEGSLAELMAEEDPQLVVLVGTPWNYASMCDRYPNFFK